MMMTSMDAMARRGAFTVDGEAWFVVASGDLALFATNRSGRMRSFKESDLEGATALAEKWIPLMQAVAAMKGFAIGLEFCAPGQPKPLKDWLREEMEELATLIDGNVMFLNEDDDDHEEDS